MTLKEINAAIRAACKAERRAPYPEATEAWKFEDGSIALVAPYVGMHENVRCRVRRALAVEWISAYESRESALLGVPATRLEDE